MKTLNNLMYLCNRCVDREQTEIVFDINYLMLNLQAIRDEIEKLQKEKEIYGNAHTQDELLIRELWTLWENLAEAGELTITSKFATKYNELKAKIK